ncbi:MAG: DUF1800 family protein [Gammaproteobacteria bacterium]|nr:DUF1800 family protein [Gammaproteobacteria bacterium]
MIKRILFLLLVSVSALASDSGLDQPLGIDDAAHLLRRAGLGAEPVQVAALASQSRADAIELLLDGVQTHPTIAMPDWVDDTAPPYWARGDMLRDDRRAFDRARDREMSDLRRWWVAEMIATPSPQTERLVLMWHNHFVSAYSGIDEESTSIARQNQMFRRLGLANFRDLLRAVIRDAAMLNYLDNRSNKKRSPNENLARELLELFTLGEGNYDEFTVKEAARALTGYTINMAANMQFSVEPWHQDKKVKNLFGQTGRFDGDDLIDIILEQDKAAEHIARLFWREYISEFTEDEVAISELALHFRQHDYELAELFRATLQRPEFWAEDYRGQLVKSPVDLLIGTIRSTGYVPRRWDALPAQLARLGQTLFDPPNVAGWSGGAGWVTPARLLNRQQTIERIFSSRKISRFIHSNGTRFGTMSTDSNMTDAGLADTMMMEPTEADSAESESMMSVERNAADGMSSADHQVLRVRVAAENYKGAPELQVRLRRHRKELWRSESVPLVAGHDTQKFGRLAGVDVMPWENLQFTLPDLKQDYTAIEVHFLNDAAGDGGDRNLYVDWVQIGDQHYYARTGKQSSGCPPREPDQAGNLYCQGHLSIPVAVKASTSGAIQDENQLIAAHAHTWWFQALQRGADWRQLVIGLTDVRLADRQWDSMTVAMVDSNELGPGLEISTDDCVQDCFREWPECAWTNEVNPDYRSLYFPLRRTSANEHLACHWESLDPQDKRLVSSLFNVLPQLIEHVRDGRKAQRRKGEFSRWAKAVKKQHRKLDSVYQVPQAATRLVLTGENISAASDPVEFSRPSVGGRAVARNTAALNAMLAEGTGHSVLLAIAPVVAASNATDPAQLLVDPAFQVK